VSEDTQGLGEEQRRTLEKLMKEVDAGRLDHQVIRRYLDEATALIGDDSPMLLDHRKRMELAKSLGKDPGALRVHTGSRAQEATEAMGARAFALGDRDIFLGSDVVHRLGSTEGKAVLAHEAMHTMQAGSGLGFSRPGTYAHDRHEAEARVIEERVLAEDDPAHHVSLPESPAGEVQGKSKEAFDPSKLLEKLTDAQKAEIEKKVMEIIEERRRLELDRMGAPILR